MPVDAIVAAELVLALLGPFLSHGHTANSRGTAMSEKLRFNPEPLQIADPTKSLILLIRRGQKPRS